VILVRFTLLHFPDNATLGRLFLIGNHFACRSAPRVGRQIKSSRPSPDDQAVVPLALKRAGDRVDEASVSRSLLPNANHNCWEPCQFHLFSNGLGVGASLVNTNTYILASFKGHTTYQKLAQEKNKSLDDYNCV
jgi:hypothetical protein